MSNRTATLGALLIAAALVSGCGSGQNSPPATQPHPTVPKTKPANAESPNMVSAVGEPKGSPVPVQVKFELKGRPGVAQPLDIDIAIMPKSGSVDRITGKVETEEGLELVEGAQIPAADRPAEGTVIHHSVRVMPKRDGIFTLSAVLAVDSAGQTGNETFSIPVIAGQGLPDLSTKPAASPANPTPPGSRPAKPAPGAAAQ